MDMKIMVAGVAVVAIIAVLLMLQTGKPGSTIPDTTTPGTTPDTTPDTTTPGTTPGTTPDTDVDAPRPPKPVLNISQSQIEDIVKPDVSGNCTLYFDSYNKKPACFGTAGGITTRPLGGEYVLGIPEQYADKYADWYCRPMPTGCRPYIKTVTYLH